MMRMAAVLIAVLRHLTSVVVVASESHMMSLAAVLTVNGVVLHDEIAVLVVVLQVPLDDLGRGYGSSSRVTTR